MQTRIQNYIGYIFLILHRSNLIISKPRSLFFFFNLKTNKMVQLIRFFFLFRIEKSPELKFIFLVIGVYKKKKTDIIAHF
jgi:hypothetical protein